MRRSVLFRLVGDAAVIRPTFERTDFEGCMERSLVGAGDLLSIGMGELRGSSRQSRKKK
jgi:hypothetical protein